MSEGQSPRAVRPAPSTKSSGGGSSGLLILAVAGVLCGGVVALAFTGREDDRSSATLEPETMGDVIDEAELRAAAAPAAPMTLAAASQSISIEMYSATWCSACARARQWMSAEGISYQEIDVDRRTDAMGQLSVLNPRRTLPTFDIDGQVLVGFDQVALTGAIDGAARRRR